MHMKGQGRDPGTSKKLKVIGKLHRVSTDMIKVESGKFKILRIVQFFIRLFNVEAWLS